MESLLTVIVLLTLSALSAWLQKRQRDSRGHRPPGLPRPLPGAGRPMSRGPARPAPPPTQTSPVPPPTGPDWLRELRRILAEETGGETSPEAPAPSPPPILTHPQAPPAPVVLASGGPDTAALDSKKQAATPDVVAHEAERVFREAQQDIDVRARELETKTPRSHLNIHEAAARLREAVAQRAKKMMLDAEAAVLTGQPIQVQRGVQPGTVINAALDALKEPGAARAAFVSALVFGPPKAFQPENVI